MPTSEAQLRASKKYQQEHTTMISCRLPNDIAKEFAEKCDVLGIGKATQIRLMIENFIAEA